MTDTPRVFLAAYHGGLSPRYEVVPEGAMGAEPWVPEGAGGWQPIETAPKDGRMHVRGIWVTSNRTGAKWWEAIAGHVDDDGDFVDHDGNSPWRAEDYTHWMPLQEPPDA